MIKIICKRFILGLLFSLACVGFANAMIISFDDINQGLIPNNYAGLTWGTSMLSMPYADSTSFIVNNNLTYSAPHSSPNFVLNGYGVPDLWFEFAATVNFDGAWFTAPSNNIFAAQQVRFVDDLGQTSEWLTLTNFPQYLAANFPGSKKILIQPRGTYNGVQTNGGWYTMDDITYASAAPVPVPSTILLLITGLIGLLVIRVKFSRIMTYDI